MSVLFIQSFEIIQVKHDHKAGCLRIIGYVLYNNFLRCCLCVQICQSVPVGELLHLPFFSIPGQRYPSDTAVQLFISFIIGPKRAADEFLPFLRPANGGQQHSLLKYRRGGGGSLYTFHQFLNIIFRNDSI